MILSVFYILVTPHLNQYQWFDEAVADHELLHGSLAELCEQLTPVYANRQVIAILSIESAVMVQVEVPKAQRRYLHQALPYLVEPLISNEIEQVHCVPVHSKGANQCTVIVCNHDLIAPLVNGLQAHQMALTELIVDTDLHRLPYSSEMVISWCEHRILISLPDEAFVCKRETLGKQLEFILKNYAISSLQLQLDVYDQTFETAEILAAEMSQYGFLKIQMNHCQGGLPAFITAAWFNRTRQPNSLLKGAYEQTKRWQHWRLLGVPTMVASLVLLSSVLLWFVSEILYLDRLTEKSWAEIEMQVATESMGQVQLDRTQWKQQLGALLPHVNANTSANNEVFIQLMLAIDRALNADVELQELRFIADQGEMQLIVLASNTSFLEQFRQQLLQDSVLATYSAIRTSDYVRGQFRMSAGGGSI